MNGIANDVAILYQPFRIATFKNDLKNGLSNMDGLHTMHYFIGLPQWHHPDWYAQGQPAKAALATYSQHFSSVEGNTTFYGIPSAATIATWQPTTSTCENFRFCLKFPKAISHDAKLQHCATTLNTFLQRIEPLTSQMGILWLQMNRYFSPEQLPLLQHFLQQLPDDFQYGVEVRHLGFFAKDDNEKRFNQLLFQHKINRVMFDTRVLFANPHTDDATQDALRKKPRVPLHVVATADKPMIRFISPIDQSLAQKALTQWVSKVIQWIDEGRTPYIFFHTPNNQHSPALAQHFSQKITQQRPDIQAITLWQKPPQQSSLF